MLDREKDRLVTLTTDKIGLSIADKLANAFDCQDAVKFEDVISGKDRLPKTQTRLTCHGHSDGSRLGSQKQYTPHQFAIALIQLLTFNPSINEIDLLSCNVGILDENGDCFAAQVKRLLFTQHYDIRINTFIVDNSNQHILNVFFVVGSAPTDYEFHDINCLRNSEFSLDIMRVHHHELIESYHNYQIALEKLQTSALQLRIIKVILNVFYKRDTENWRSNDTNKALKTFKTYLHNHYQYDNEKANQLIIQYGISFKDPYNITCRLPFMETLSHFQFKSDITRMERYLTEKKQQDKRNFAHIANMFSVLRAEQARVCKGPLCAIRDYLSPVCLTPIKRKKLSHINLFAEANGNLNTKVITATPMLKCSPY